MTVSRHTNLMAQEHGVVLVVVAHDFLFYKWPYCTAYDCQEGQVVRTGSLGWVEKELNILGAEIRVQLS